MFRPTSRAQIAGAVLILGPLSAMMIPSSRATECSVLEVARSEDKVNSCIGQIHKLGDPPETSSSDLDTFFSDKVKLQEDLFHREALLHDDASNCLSCQVPGSADLVASLGPLANADKLADESFFKPGFFEIEKDLKEITAHIDEKPEGPKKHQALQKEMGEQVAIYDKMLRSGKDDKPFNLPCAHPTELKIIPMPPGNLFSPAVSNAPLATVKQLPPETGTNAPPLKGSNPSGSITE